MISNLKRLLKDEDCILFGAGAGGESVYSFICDNIESGRDKIKCFVDNNPLKWGTYFMGKPVLSVDDKFSIYKGEVVIIICGEGDEIISQLEKYDISCDRITFPI